MNVSGNGTSVVFYRDSFSKALVKNLFVVFLNIIINSMNAILIHTFRTHPIFYTNPRYILFVHLVVNDVLLMTLSTLMFVLSYVVFQINASVCCVLILGLVLTSENTPLTVACMAVECYIAVCLPLRHSQICTVRRTLMLIGLIWVSGLLLVLSDLFITLATLPLDFFHSRIFCLRETVFPLALILKKREIIYIVYLVLLWTVIFFAYFKILFAAKTVGRDAKKARNTVMLHGFQLLLCMSHYATQLLKQLFIQLFPKNISDMLYVSHIIIQVLPRSLSPIIYGVRDKTFRSYMMRHLMRNTNTR